MMANGEGSSVGVIAPSQESFQKEAPACGASCLSFSDSEALVLKVKVVIRMERIFG
jgi:hypothetical protein